MRVELNFAAERRDDYASSNFRPEWTTLELNAHTVEIHNARLFASPARLDREGFELHRLPFAGGDWESSEWVEESYVTHARKLVIDITKGIKALTFPGSWVLRDTGREGFAPAASYVHMDREYETCRELVRKKLGQKLAGEPGRFEMINVWRSLTPPPQDHGLVLCDQRTVDRNDWAVCETLEPRLEGRLTHTVSVHNPTNRWCYYPGLEQDEVIVFRSYNDNENGLPGCLHTAFRDPTVRNAVPRASFEIRFYVFHNE